LESKPILGITNESQQISVISYKPSQLSIGIKAKNSQPKSGKYKVFANGTIHYQINGKNVAVTSLWNYEAPEGGGDAYSALIKGTKASLEIVQNKEENYIKQLYIEKNKRDGYGNI